MPLFKDHMYVKIVCGAREGDPGDEVTICKHFHIQSLNCILYEYPLSECRYTNV